jgi:hypothetical protein
MWRRKRRRAEELDKVAEVQKLDIGGDERVKEDQRVAKC